MSMKTMLAAAATLAVLGLCAPACADEHAWREGVVVNVARIRTVDGKFDDYMKWLDTVWKKMQEAGKKSGDVVGYEVMACEPRTPDDPDIVLVVRYKNWAALDGAQAKGDAIAKAVEGSVAAASKSQGERASIRRVLGSETMQVMELK